jgi:GntR family transcriptional regulator
MDPNWKDSQPIYRQLRDRMVALILEGALQEGAPLPSVRAVAADYRVNPLTVLKGYQQLVEERLVEKRRGLGLFVSDGTRRVLLAGERERFLKEDWPHILAAIHRLGFSAAELFAQTPAQTHPAPSPRGGQANDKE